MIEYTDRYGGNYPDPDTMCKGQCEGLGFYPEWQGETDDEGRMIIDGEGDFIFITCPECGGTGKSND